jgi:hypothetical protein
MNLKNLMLVILIMTIGIFINGCSQSSDEEIAKAVEATLQAIPTETLPSPTDTPMPSTNTPTKAPISTSTDIPPSSTPKPTSTATETPLPTNAATPLPPLFGDVEPLLCEVDDFKGIEWCSKYATTDIEDYVLSGGTADTDFAIYTGALEGEAFLRWDILYNGDDWIFLDEIILMIDGKAYDVPVNEYEDITTDVYGGGRVIEQFDRFIDDIKIPLMIAFADEVKLRVAGSDGFYDKTLTVREIEIVRRALKSYEDKGGQFTAKDIQEIDFVNYKTPTPTSTPTLTPVPPHIISGYVDTLFSYYYTLKEPQNLGSKAQWNGCSNHEIPFEAIATSSLSFEKIGHYEDRGLKIELFTQSGDLVGTIFEGKHIDGYFSTSIDLVPGVVSYVLKIETEDKHCDNWHITMIPE